MLVSLAFLATSVTGGQDLPLTVDVTSYVRVQHALKDGSPDLTAPDNTFERDKDHYVLAADSDVLPADAKGNRLVHQNAFSFEIFEGYDETGPTPDSMRSKFTSVGRLGSGSMERKIGGGTIPEQEQLVYKGNRMIVYHVRTTQERVEIHTQGTVRVTRKWHETSWSIFGTMVRDGKPIDVKKPDLFGTKASFRVNVDPPIYRFSR
jgi:hypothetical protein